MMMTVVQDETPKSVIFFTRRAICTLDSEPYSAPETEVTTRRLLRSTSIDLWSSEAFWRRCAHMELLDERPDIEVLDGPVKQGTIRVILADSQAIYRVGIRKIFALEDDIRVVAQADSLEHLRSAIEQHSTDVALVEGELLTGATSSIPELLRIAPDIKLIVQTLSADEGQTVELYRRGIRGIISRSISPDLLVRCVRRIATGETWIDNEATNWVIEAYRAQEALRLSHPRQPRLSPKETAVIRCVTQGKRNKEIASQLGTSEQVIKNYLRKIYDKLGVEDRIELALHCLHNNII